MSTSPSPLPLAPAVERWAYQGRGEQSEHGPCQLVYRTLGESPALTEKLERALDALRKDAGEAKDKEAKAAEKTKKAG